jgi:type II secretion system protein G
MFIPKIFKGFTLIELLIVVAIIAILAAIAVPNFLEAQVRSKVSRAQADMRSLATALESYHIDANHYPRDEVWWALSSDPPPLNLRALRALSSLSTPQAYMTSIPKNPFPNKTDNPAEIQAYFRYFAERWIERVNELNPGAYPATSKRWSLASAGPDGISNVGEYLIFGFAVLESMPGALPWWGPGCLYDPTNGTVSAGDIVRVGP